MPRHEIKQRFAAARYLMAFADENPDAHVAHELAAEILLTGLGGHPDITRFIGELPHQ